MNPTQAAVVLLLATILQSPEAAMVAPPEAKPNVPEVIQPDVTLRLGFGDGRVILPRGLQP